MTHRTRTLVAVAVILTGCAGTDAPNTTANTIAATIGCTDLTRMDPSAELITAESWTCTLNGEHLRIDRFRNSGDRARVLDTGLAAADVIVSTGDTWTITCDTPDTCGRVRVAVA